MFGLSHYPNYELHITKRLYYLNVFSNAAGGVVLYALVDRFFGVCLALAGRCIINSKPTVVQTSVLYNHL